MATVKLAFRRRGIRRARPRPNAAGNFITRRVFSIVYFLTFSRTDSHYIKWDAYRHPYPPPVGYVFPPPPSPGWQVLGPATDPETVNNIEAPEPYAPVPPPSAPAPAFPSTPIFMPIPVPPPPLPGRPTPTPTTPMPASDFAAKTLTLTTAETRLSAQNIPVRSILLLAHPDNTGDILFRSIRGSATDAGSLGPGQGVILDIGNPAIVIVRAAAGSQTLTVVWEMIQ